MLTDMVILFSCIMFLLAGWAFADSVLHRLAPLWVGARGLEFTWEYILQGMEANANLVISNSYISIKQSYPFPQLKNRKKKKTYILKINIA